MKEKTFQKREDYIYASSRIRVHEKRLIPLRQMQQLFEAGDYEEAMRLFKDTPYAAGFTQASGELSYDEVLEAERKRLFAEIAEAAPGSPLIRLISLNDAYHNLKVLLKQVLLEKDLSYLLVEPESLDLNYLSNIIRSPERNPLETPEEKALGAAAADYAEHQDPQRSEMLVDKAMYEELLSLAKGFENPLIGDWVKEQIDFINLETFLRLMRQHRSAGWLETAFIEGGRLPQKLLIKAYEEGALPSEAQLKGIKLTPRVREALARSRETGDPAVLEKARDEASLETAEEGLRMTYGPEVLFGYWLRREMEMLNLRMLLVSLKSGMSAEKRGERLRRLPR